MKFFFGTIVVNNSELIKQWINHYSKLGECFVVEGATQDWKSALGWSGHNSTDGTVEIIRSSGVPHIIADRPWRDKTEQCNAFMRAVPPDTDYVFYADSDEITNSHGIEVIRQFLTDNPETTHVTLNMLHWWKHREYFCVGGDGWAYDTPIPRIWKWFPGAEFRGHRPPQILRGGNDLAKVNPVPFGPENEVECFHYSYCFRQQVLDKLKYYSKVFGRDYMKWFREVWEPWSPATRKSIESKMSVHPSCSGARTERYQFDHPIEVPWE